MAGQSGRGSSSARAVHLLHSPTSARRLMGAVARDELRQGSVAKTMEDLRALASATSATASAAGPCWERRTGRATAARASGRAGAGSR